VRAGARWRSRDTPPRCTDRCWPATDGPGPVHRSDAITSAAAGVGIAIALIGGKGFEAADDWGALVACVMIIINGVLILRGSLHDVLDGNVDALLVENVKDVASAVTSAPSLRLI
jgi:divalent metal cation (Fe/Co/Zn/Cd) transporter